MVEITINKKEYYKNLFMNFLKNKGYNFEDLGSNLYKKIQGEYLSNFLDGGKFIANICYGENHIGIYDINKENLDKLLPLLEEFEEKYKINIKVDTYEN